MSNFGFLEREYVERFQKPEAWTDLSIEADSAANVPDAEAQLELIHAVQTDESWKDATLAMIENVRRRLRGLIQFIDKKSSKPVYSALDDEVGEARPVLRRWNKCAGINNSNR